MASAQDAPKQERKANYAGRHEHHRVDHAPRHCEVRHDTVNRHGKVTLRYDSRLHHIGLGRRHRGKAIVLLVADRDIRIVDADGELLRHLVLDPTRDYQRQSA